MFADLEGAVYDKISSVGEVAINNICPKSWFECDVCRITNSLYFHEYEIKKSRTDYFNDFKKGQVRPGWPRAIEPEYGKHYRMSVGDTDGPNRFFFITPENLISEREVPDHCGLMYFTERGLKLIKNAPILHREKVSREFLIMVLKAFNLRLFKIRRGLSHA